MNTWTNVEPTQLTNASGKKLQPVRPGVPGTGVALSAAFDDTELWHCSTIPSTNGAKLGSAPTVVLRARLTASLPIALFVKAFTDVSIHWATH